MKIAIIMDPVEKVHIDQDTTFALALEAQSRGCQIWYVSADDLMLKKSEPWCTGRAIEFRRDTPCYEWLGEEESRSLEGFDYILMRKDPPFDEKFFFATHILSLCKKAIVVNRPLSLRNAPEKIYGLNFPEINPPSIVTANAGEIKKFMHEHEGGVILKPLNRCGGAGILYLHKDDKNFNSLVEMSTQEGKEYVIVQQYLPEIKQGDKRVICVNGEPLGAILRTPGKEDHRGNIHVGGQVTFSELTKRDKWLVDQISEQLKHDGLYFVGLDIIGDYITEINVTSPTGVQEIKRLGGIDIAKTFWDNLHKMVV